MNMSAMSGVQSGGMSGGMSGCNHSQMDKTRAPQAKDTANTTQEKVQNAEPGVGNKIDIQI